MSEKNDAAAALREKIFAAVQYTRARSSRDDAIVDAVMAQILPQYEALMAAARLWMRSIPAAQDCDCENCRLYAALRAAGIDPEVSK